MMTLIRKIKLFPVILMVAFWSEPTVYKASAYSTSAITGGLNAAIGIDLDETNNHLYFVEYAGNDLKRISLSALPVTIETIASGLVHPEDVVLNMAQGCAYVTTRDNPGTGGLWKIDLASKTKTLVTFNLGAPQQIAPDYANNRVYTVGYDDGRLRYIDLSTGAKTVITTSLIHPVGLIISSDGKYAFITEQGPPTKISQIDLTTGVKIRELTPAGLTAPFFLCWTDFTENSFYVVERDPANRVARIDLATGDKTDAFMGLPWRPSSVITGNFGTKLYVASDDTITQIDLALNSSVPGFMGIGHVPFSCIDSLGYATTDPGYFYQVKNAPFGGSMNLFGNLQDMINVYGARYYSISVSKDGAAPEELTTSWNTYMWDTTLEKQRLVTISPETDTPFFKIPEEYALHAGWWYPPFQIMRWTSGENGMYTFYLKIYDINRVEITPAIFKPMKIRVDNNRPEVRIQKIYQLKPPKTEIDACVMVDNGDNKFKYEITAYDAEGHLYSYYLRAFYADNQTHHIVYDNYNAHVNAPPPPYNPKLWYGVLNQEVPAGIDTVPCNCAYTFYLDVWGRTINGYNYIQYGAYHKSITINLPSLSICP